MEGGTGEAFRPGIGYVSYQILPSYDLCLNITLCFYHDWWSYKKALPSRDTGYTGYKYPNQHPDDQITHRVDHLDVVWGIYTRYADS